MSDQAEKLKRIERLLERAGKIVAAAEVEFDQRLGREIDELRSVMSAGDHKAALTMAYRLKGRSGSLGWPLVASAANALAKLLERNPDMGTSDREADVFLEALDLICSQGMKGEDPRGQLLVRELYQLVENPETPKS